MPVIDRLFVEKKKGFDIEAQHLKRDINENLGIKSLKELRIVNRYDIEGLESKYFNTVKNIVFAEPPVDNIYEDELPIDEDEAVFAMEYLPGQFDQRADSAVQCIQIITGSDTTAVSVAKLFVLKGERLSEDDIEKIKAYCINPVDSRQAALEKPESLAMQLTTPEDVKTFEGFIDMSDEETAKMRTKLGLAMSPEDLIFCRDYFNKEKRNPTVTEIRVIDTYWSDHCRHTTFAASINSVEIEDGPYKAVMTDAYNMYISERKQLGGENKNICLMDIAKIGMKALKAKGLLDNLDESEEINACSIEIDVDINGEKEKWLLMFKNETHNHPTEIEPFGGAATCLGGAIRDPLSGRSYVYQAMRVTGSGNPLAPVSKTLAGKLPQRKITESAAHGYSSYGNQIGLATGQVVEIYDEGYVAKRMEIGAVIGAVPKNQVVRERPVKDDLIILVGGRTGRDGCGGATGSSKEHDEQSLQSCGAEVQKGNPPTERKLQRLFRKPEVSLMIKRCNDFGAGGVSVAVGELAEGLVISLDSVPKKYEGLDGTELAISESQERMAVVVDKQNADRFIELAAEENLEATLVARVTDDRRLKMNWRGKTIVDISRDFLDTNGITQNADVLIKMPQTPDLDTKKSGTLEEKWTEVLSDLNVACQKGLAERFDSTIGAGTVLLPFGGRHFLTPSEAMVAKIPVLKGETNTVSMMAFGYDPKIAKWSPFHAAIYAVVESISKIVATGGKFEDIRLTFQEYFEHLGSDPVKWGKPFAALLGAFYAQMKLGIAAIGGKDSMSGTFKDMNVPPTLVSFAVDTADVKSIISPEFKLSGNKILLIEAQYEDNGLPNFDSLIKEYTAINKLIKAGGVISASSVGKGGIAASISKMCFGNMLGAEIDYDDLFSSKYGSFIVELNDSVDAQKELDGVKYSVIGKTVAKTSITANGTVIKIDNAVKEWFKPLESVFPTMYYKPYDSGNIKIKPYTAKEKIMSEFKTAQPRVFIPVFPGTNCEYDSRRAFEKAGAVVETLVISNVKTQWLEEAIIKAEKLINNSQIIMLPGGFSAGDEPDGSGKFIAAVFRNPRIREAVMNLLKNRDGLMLGICNGFQALIKLGLVPCGEICDINESSPTLTFNTVGRHISCLNNTKIISTKSPWLWKTNVGDTHTIAFSHGEGRFVASEETIRSLEKNGQIATQYCDLAGEPTYDIRYNPNGSHFAIEGITSPDGRVLGKMGHSERIGAGLYKNAYGSFDQHIFESGVEYYK